VAGSPGDGELSRSDVVFTIVVGCACVGAVWSVVFFELINGRYRSVDRAGSPGFVLALMAFALAFLIITAPIGIVLAYLARRRIRSAGVRYARGAATTTVAFAANGLALVLLAREFIE